MSDLLKNEETKDKKILPFMNDLSQENFKTLEEQEKRNIFYLMLLFFIKKDLIDTTKDNYHIKDLDGLKVSFYKYMFMVHLLYYKHTGSHLTHLKFYRSNYGPYAPALVKNSSYKDGFELIINEYLMEHKEIKVSLEKFASGLLATLKDIFKDDNKLFEDALTHYDYYNWIDWSHKLKIFQQTPFGYEICFDYYDEADLLKEISYDYKQADKNAIAKIDSDKYIEIAKKIIKGNQIEC